MKKIGLILFSAIVSLFSGQNSYALGFEDITSILKNPTFDAKDGWTLEQTSSSTLGWSGVGGTAPYNVIEAYAGWSALELTEFTMKQDVTLDAGNYRLVSQSFHRGEGYAKLFVTIGNDTHKIFVADLDAATLANKPNSVIEASKAFAANAYQSFLDFTVTSDGSIVTLGIEGEHTAAKDWFISGPFKLYKGTESTPIDVTNLAYGATTTFTNATGGYYGGDVWTQERYQASPYPIGDIITATISDLPIGTYGVELYAAASSAWGASSIPAENPYVYANDVQADVVAEETNAVPVIPYYKLENVKVTDGTLNIGIANRAEGSNWELLGIKSLKYVPAPIDIIVNVTSGDITTAIEAEMAKVAKVGNITINLTEGINYTVSGSIVAPAGLEINGNGATIDASACVAPFIIMSKEPTAEKINDYYRVESVTIKDLKVNNLKNSIFYDNSTKYCVVNFTIDNTVLNLTTEAVQNEALVSFKMGGAKDFNITNSTVYGNGVSKYFIRYNNSARLDRYGFDKTTEFQTMNYQNNTFYNVIATGGQWGNYNGINGQVYSKFDVQNNIWFNCGTNVIRRMAGGRFNGNNPMTFAKNTYFYNDVDNSAVEASYDKSGDILTSNPGFKDAANGDFTLDAISEQNINKTGDPRWIVTPPTINIPNIATLKDLTNGTPVKLTLNNAIVTANTFGGRRMFTVIEDNSGAIQLSGNMAIEGITEKAILNGTLYATYVNEWGAIMLDLSDSTQYSQFTSSIAESVKPKQSAIFKSIDNDEILRFVELKYLNITYDSLTYCYNAIQAQDTIQIVDAFFKLPFDEVTYETIMPKALERMTGFITYNGEAYQFYPYAHDGKSPIVEYVAAEPNFEIETYAIQEGETHVSGESVELDNLTITFGETGGAEFKAGAADSHLEGFPAFTEGNGTNGNKVGGTFYTFVPKKSGQLCVAVVLNGNKAFYVEEDGTALENFNGIKVANKFYGCYTFDVKEGSTYKVYCAGSKLGFYGCILSYEVLKTGGVSYALAEGDAPKSGEIVELDNITLTYGEEGGKDFNAAAKESSVEGYTAFTSGNGTNGNKSGGTFYTFKPAMNGQITVAVVLNSNKSFYIEEDGTALPEYNGIRVESKYNGTYTFDVKAGSTYKVYASGSKLGFYGFNYVYINSKRAPIAPEATGIENINSTIDQDNGNVYSINGTMVRKSGDSIRGLAKGLYIINGKKVVIK